MSEDDARRIFEKLDGLSRDVAGIVERVAWVRDSTERLTGKIDSISASGCQVGRRNTEAIETMKSLQRDTNSIKVGGVVVNGGVAVLAVVVAYMVLKMHGITP